MKRQIMCVLMMLVLVLASTDFMVFANEMQDDSEGISEETEYVTEITVEEDTAKSQMESGKNESGNDTTAIDSSVESYAVLSEPVRGQCGDNLTWTIENETLTISGTGDMEDYSYYSPSRPWDFCRDQLRKLVINDGVTSIGDFAFSNYDCFIGDLIIPDSVTSIGDSAFFYCTGFTGDLVIPDSVIEIGDRAFYVCSGFTGSLVIGNSVTSIGRDAFWDCGFTGNLVIGNSITDIDHNMFVTCRGFTGNLVIGNKVKSIADEAFAYVGFTGNLVIPDSVENIGESAFRSCTGFTGDLVIPDSVENIGLGAFYGCSGFTGSLVIGNSVAGIGNGTFYGCSGFTGNLVIPSSVTSIGAGDFFLSGGAFEGCSGFTGNLIIGNSVVSIENDSFKNCSGFTGNLIIPDSVVSIGESAFYGCYGFTGNLSIPDSVTSIGEWAFDGCSGFTGNLSIPDSVTSIGGGAFDGCSGFTGNLSIPDSVTSIGGRAFYGCSGFDSLYIGESVDYVESYAFYGCTGFLNIYFSCNVFDSISKICVGLWGNNCNWYYPINRNGWQDVIKQYSDLNWIPYGAGLDPILPNLWIFMQPDVEKIAYNFDTGYNVERFNLSVSSNYIDLNDEPKYTNINMTLELPYGLSFSGTENMKTVSATYEKVQDIRDQIHTIYIDSSYVKDRFDITVKLTADGYVTPQISTKSIPVELERNAAVETIIDVVEKYTDHQDLEAVNEILASSLTEEEKFQKVYEYFNYDNIFDLREQLLQLQEVSKAKWSYIGLMEDEMYHSWQWWHYLNETPKGYGARASLVLSGLAFNGELGDWLDLSTYLDGDYPGVEKYKSLLEEFISVQNAEIEYYSYVKETEKFINSLVGVCSDVEKGEVLKELGKTKNVVGVNSVLNKFVESKISWLDGEEINLKYEEKTAFMSKMGLVNDVFKTVNFTLDGIMGFLEVSSNLETYEVYKKFLWEVYDAKELPWEMRVAAYKIIQEMEQGYWTPMQKILNTIRDECLSEALDVAGINEILKLNGWSSAVKFSTFCINQFVDIGKLVINSAHTEGYAMLAGHYKNKLEECKTQFLSNRSEKNAWEFYDTYTMLWLLRREGESKYLKMNKLEANEWINGMGIKLNDIISEACSYKDKEASVKRILETLETFKFKYDIKSSEIPDGYKHLQKIVVECPVDVEFLTADGMSVCILNDGEETDLENSHGRFITVYRATTGDYVKIAYINDDSAYIVRAVGQDSGQVSYSHAQTENHISFISKGFDDIFIEKNSVIELFTNAENYTVDVDADGEVDIQARQVDKSRLSVQFDCQNGKQILVCYANNDGNITMPEVPVRDGYMFKGWYTELSGLGIEFTGASSVDKNLTVYAKWETVDKSVGTVSGTVKTFGNVKDSVLVRLLQGTNEIARQEILNDTYFMGDIEAGTYLLEVSKENHVTRVYPLEIADNVMTQNVELHLIGDVTGDGKVNVADKLMIYKHIENSVKLVEYDFLVGEITGDRNINVADKLGIYKHIEGTKMLWE